ncbi:MAG TPA: PAS domain S-box protein [bacterium]|mgnify:CR=1 FL=1|nr:PAS domain S-box protein [bacterium]
MTDSRISVLMIEDDQIDQKAFERFLSRGEYPYRCTYTSSLAEGLSRLSRETFDVILVDYQLGDGTALDLLKKCRDTPVIVITGMGNEEIAINAMKTGASDYLIKDIEGYYLKIIPMTIESAIRRWKNQQMQRLLSHTIRSISDAVFITDMADRFIFVNPAFEAIYGYRFEEIVHNSSRMIWDDPEENHQSLASVTRSINVEWNGRVRHRRKSGEAFPAMVSRSAVRDENGQNFALVGIARDISELVGIENEREKMLQEIHSLLNRFQKMRIAIPVGSKTGNLEDIKAYWRRVARFLDDQEGILDSGTESSPASDTGRNGNS